MQAISHLYMLKHLFYCRKTGRDWGISADLRWVIFGINSLSIFDLPAGRGGRLQIYGGTVRFRVLNVTGLNCTVRLCGRAGPCSPSSGCLGTGLGRGPAACRWLRLSGWDAVAGLAGAPVLAAPVNPPRRLPLLLTRRGCARRGRE